PQEGAPPDPAGGPDQGDERCDERGGTAAGDAGRGAGRRGGPPSPQAGTEALADAGPADRMSGAWRIYVHHHYSDRGGGQRVRVVPARLLFRSPAPGV